MEGLPGSFFLIQKRTVGLRVPLPPPLAEERNPFLLTGLVKDSGTQTGKDHSQDCE